MMKGLLGTGGMMLALAFTTAVQAQELELKAKGRGANGDGSSFSIKSLYQVDPSHEQATFKIKGGVAGETHTVCFSTDGCTYSFQMTVDPTGRAFVKFDSHDGTVPPDFPSLSAGDQLLVDGVAVATYKRKR